MCYQSITQKHTLLCLHPVKLFLKFGHFATPKLEINIGALVIYGTQPAPSEVESVKI